MRSKAGWALAALYLVISALLLGHAVQCRGEFFCGISAILVLIPTGFVYVMLFGEHLASPAILQWQLLIPTLATNVLFYFWLGRFIGKWLRPRR